jgi:L-iditol 2-dehydrogenase
MRIAVLEGPRRFRVVEEPVPTVAAGQVLVRVVACGVCASELDTWLGRGSTEFPQRPGHEVSGTVVEVAPDVDEFTVGQEVAVWTTGRGFAEYVAVAAEHCRPAGGVPLEQALVEPVACASNAVELADVRLADDVVIVGAGFMGNLVQQLVRLRGARQVVVADTRPDALAQATRLGATRVVDVRSESLPDVVAEVTDGAMADVTFEVTGAQAALEVLDRTTRMSGTVVLVGFHQGEPRSIPLGSWNWMAYDIVNAHFREPATIMRGMTVGMRLLRAGHLSLDGLVTHRFPLEHIDEAFSAAVAKPEGFVKATVTMGA